MKNSRYDTVLLLSGGLDSAVMAYQLTSLRKRTRALYFDMGTDPSEQEIHAAKAVTFRLGIPLEIIEMKGILPMARGYIPPHLLGPDEADMKDLDLAFVPATGFPIMLSVATYYAQITRIDSVSLAVIKEQTVKRPHMKTFFAEFPKVVDTVNLSGASKFVFETPFIDMTKVEVVALGAQLETPFADTWTCQFGKQLHCGKCIACSQRKMAFTASEILDPTAYES